MPASRVAGSDAAAVLVPAAVEDVMGGLDGPVPAVQREQALVGGRDGLDDDFAQVHAAPGPSNENAPFLPNPGRQVQYWT